MNEAAEAEPPPGFLSRLVGLYFTPSETMRQVARRPTFWAPLLAFMAVTAAFNAVWLRAMDPAAFVRAQIEDSPIADHLSPEARAAGIAEQTRLFPLRSWLGPLVFSPLSLVFVAAAYLAVFRFFYEGQLVFRQSLAVVAWTYFGAFLVILPLTLLVLYLKQDWNVDPQSALQANLTLLFEKRSVPRAVYSLAESLDLFSAWMLALLSIGYGAATPTRAGRAAIGVIAVWAVFVLGKAAVAAFF